MTNLGELILKHHAPYRELKRDIFDGWLAWNVHNGFVVRAIGDEGETVGVGIIRPVMKPEDGHDHYEYDPEGSVLFVDTLICLHPSAMAAIGMGVLQRFGMRETVAWKRPPFFVIKTIPAARLRQHIFRKAMSHGR